MVTMSPLTNQFHSSGCGLSVSFMRYPDNLSFLIKTETKTKPDIYILARTHYSVLSMLGSFTHMGKEGRKKCFI